MTDEQTTMERYTITFYLLPQYDQSQILHSLTVDFPLQDTRWKTRVNMMFFWLANVYSLFIVLRF